jgi:HEAT repeat protein
MPRKNSKNAKSFTTEKHFTTVPPKAKPAEIAPVVAAVAVATPAPVVVAEIAKPAIIADLKPMLACLHDMDADIAREAATALGNSGNPAAVEPLIEIIQNTNGYFHSVVRSAAAAGLATLNDRRAVEALLNAVNDPITDPSTEAIRALAKLADPRAIAALVTVVRNETGFFAGSVRRAAVLGLAQLGGETAKSVLREVAADENEDTVIREEALEAINKK